MNFMYVSKVVVINHENVISVSEIAYNMMLCKGINDFGSRLNLIL
jgi:hypothetical protein